MDPDMKKLEVTLLINQRNGGVIGRKAIIFYKDSEVRLVREGMSDTKPSFSATSIIIAGQEYCVLETMDQIMNKLTKTVKDHPQNDK